MQQLLAVLSAGMLIFGCADRNIGSKLVVQSREQNRFDHNLWIGSGLDATRREEVREGMRAVVLSYFPVTTSVHTILIELGQPDNVLLKRDMDPKEADFALFGVEGAMVLSYFVGTVDNSTGPLRDSLPRELIFIFSKDGKLISSRERISNG